MYGGADGAFTSPACTDMENYVGYRQEDYLKKNIDQGYYITQLPGTILIRSDCR